MKFIETHKCCGHPVSESHGDGCWENKSRSLEKSLAEEHKFRADAVRIGRDAQERAKAAEDRVRELTSTCDAAHAGADYAEKKALAMAAQLEVYRENTSCPWCGVRARICADGNSCGFLKEHLATLGQEGAKP